MPILLLFVWGNMIFSRQSYILTLFPKNKKRVSDLFQILLYFQEPHEQGFVEIYGLPYYFCNPSKLCEPDRQDEMI